MTLDIHVNWQLLKQENRWPVSGDHIAGSDVVSKDVVQVNLGQLMHATYIFVIWYERSIS